MGIPSCRFVDRIHDRFICAICLDVASNPVALTNCDHIFCSTCIESIQNSNCPTCQAPLKEPKWNELKGTVKQIYNDLNMKCLNPSCDQSLTISSYENHDENCPITVNICEDCKFKIRRTVEQTKHSCIQVLKGELENRFDDIEKKVEKMMSFQQQKSEKFHKVEIEWLNGTDLDSGKKDWVLFALFTAELNGLTDFWAQTEHMRKKMVDKYGGDWVVVSSISDSESKYFATTYKTVCFGSFVYKGMNWLVFKP